MNIKLDLDTLNKIDRDFLIEMLPYVSPHIQQTTMNKNDVYVVADEQYSDEITKKTNDLKKMILCGKLSTKEIPIKTLVDHTAVKTQNNHTIFPALLESKSIFEITDGVYAYSGIVLKLFRYFSKKIEDFGYKTFENIIEHEYPVLYPIKKYAKGKYFETFPHYIMFQTVMNNDLDTLNRFSKNGVEDPSIFNEMKKPIHVLRHAACAPVYEIMSNCSISPDKPFVFMVSGKCFRNEADNIYELARLNEFTMKEYVFMGTPEQCNNGIKKAKELWKFWADTFQLNCKVDTANDSFFASNYKKLKLFQILGDSKQEFKWNIPFSGSYIACSSANFHRTHFSKPYNIKTDEGTYCHTACFAFGIERLVYAFLNQKGIDPDKWDNQTYTEISSYISLQ